MFNKPTSGFRGGFVEHPSPSLAAQQSVTKIIFLTHVYIVTPKARAKHELLSNKLALGHFIYQKLIFSYSFRCDRIYSCQRYDFGHPLLCKLSLT
jgi:hypothetical protein